MSTQPKQNKTTRVNKNRKIVGAIKKHLSGPVTFAGVTYTPATLATMFQDGIDIADATDAAKKAWHAAVAKEKEKTLELSSVQTSLRNYVSALFGETSTEFADFGFSPKKVRTVTVKTKATAVDKRAATRVARHTMGSRQKEDITGDNSHVVTAAAATPAAPAAPEGRSASTSNGTSAPKVVAVV